MVMMVRGRGWVIAAAVLALLVVVSAEDLKGECSADFQKVMACLSFAQGNSPTPSKECCDSMSSIKDKDPKCLCYIIQQTQTGSGAQQLKSLGVQIAKLLQLPSACQLKNASISNCPRLLGISPNSPDAAIFNNANASASATPAAATGGTSAPDKSNNVTPTGWGAHVPVPVLLIALAFFLQVDLGGTADLF